jgi:hypothetical protein
MKTKGKQHEKPILEKQHEAGRRTGPLCGTRDGANSPRTELQPLVRTGQAKHYGFVAELGSDRRIRHNFW